MPLNLADATAGTQRLQIDNSGNTEFGSATPSAPLTFGGRELMNGSTLVQSVAAPPAMGRVTGSLQMGDINTTITISAANTVGFGSINGSADIYSANGGTFEVYPYPAGANTTLGYSVF